MYDCAIGDKGAAIRIYASYMDLNFGKGYLRNCAVMNPIDGSTIAGTTILNDGGNGFLAIGTGSIIYAQIGYLFNNNFLGSKHGKIMPYICYTNANFDRFKKSINTYNAGVNWFIDKHKAKISLDIQNRPIFNSILLKEQ